MSGGGSKENISIETFSGDVLASVEYDVSNEEIIKFIKEETGNNSDVYIKKIENEYKILYAFVNNRHVLIEWLKSNGLDEDLDD